MLKIDSETLERLTFFIGGEGKSCEEACSAVTTGSLKLTFEKCILFIPCLGQYECVPGEFEMINQCAVLDVAFPEIGGSCSFDTEGQFSPGANGELRKLIVGADFFKRPPTCKSKAAHFKRLCPCGKPVQKRGSDVTEKVRPFLVERLKIRHEDEKRKIAEGNAGGPVKMWEKKDYLPLWTFPASKMLMTLETSTDFKIVQAVDTTCYNAWSVCPFFCRQGERRCFLSAPR